MQLDLPGYAIGGLAVGEPREDLFAVVRQTTTFLPTEKPRYLMGVGLPHDLVEAVAAGVDMFDCVVPTRNARNATAFTRRGRLRLKTPATPKTRNRSTRIALVPLVATTAGLTCAIFSRPTKYSAYA